MRRWLLAAVLASLAPLASTAGAQIPAGALKLQTSYGGALILGRMPVPKDDELIGVWSSLGRARLLKCTPKCEITPTFPVSGTLALGSDSPDRIVLGGEFKAGQRISLVLRFRQGLVVNTIAVVGK